MTETVPLFGLDCILNIYVLWSLCILSRILVCLVPDKQKLSAMKEAL